MFSLTLNQTRLLFLKEINQSLIKKTLFLITFLLIGIQHLNYSNSCASLKKNQQVQIKVSVETMDEKWFSKVNISQK